MNNQEILQPNSIVSIVSIKNLEKKYVTDSEELTVLHDLNLEVEKGSKVVIVGESGCGKSTLLNIIGGIDKLTGGTVVATSENKQRWEVSLLSEKELSQYRSKFIGFIFQFHHLLKDFTALENVYMPALIAFVGIGMWHFFISDLLEPVYESIHEKMASK